MLHIRSKRASKGVTFAGPQTHASSSKPVSLSAAAQPKSARAGHIRDASTATSARASRHHSSTPTKVSNSQRRLASLFMALMASSPLPIEADAETLEAAQKASIAPKVQITTTHKRHVSTTRVQEIRAGRWKRLRYELSLKTRRKSRTRRCEEVEMDDLVELRGAERSKGHDMA